MFHAYYLYFRNVYQIKKKLRQFSAAGDKQDNWVNSMSLRFFLRIDGCFFLRLTKKEKAKEKNIQKWCHWFPYNFTPYLVKFRCRSEAEIHTDSLRQQKCKPSYLVLFFLTLFKARHCLKYYTIKVAFLE